MVTTKPQDLKIKHSDVFFFDTNIWLLIFAPISDYQKRDQTAYSNLFGQLISRDSMIYINSMIISEFANVLLRIDYNQWVSEEKKVGAKYKQDFVGTEEYKKSVKNVEVLINKILETPIVERISDSFNAIEIDNVFFNFGIADFNDAYITELAEKGDYTIVTNDADFKNVDADITIVTTK